MLTPNLEPKRVSHNCDHNVNCRRRHWPVFRGLYHLRYWPGLSCRRDWYPSRNTLFAFSASGEEVLGHASHVSCVEFFTLHAYGIHDKPHPTSWRPSNREARRRGKDEL